MIAVSKAAISASCWIWASDIVVAIGNKVEGARNGEGDGKMIGDVDPVSVPTDRYVGPI